MQDNGVQARRSLLALVTLGGTLGFIGMFLFAGFVWMLRWVKWFLPTEWRDGWFYVGSGIGIICAFIGCFLVFGLLSRACNRKSINDTKI